MANKPQKGRISRIEYKDENERYRESIDEEEVEIRQPGSESGTDFQGHRNFHFQTTGCLGTLLGLVVITVLFFVFIPVGILVLTGVIGYYAWKLRRRQSKGPF